ncbi:MAG: acylphosphatase [Paramuribaculum sp.]|nr:acylphosphatase [Paramuribaculum sp.]
MTSGWILVSVKGVVQGVGFRPAVYRVARRMGLVGTVENAVDGVHIMLRATPATASLLIDGVRGELPGAARIDSVECRPCPTPSPLPESCYLM